MRNSQQLQEAMGGAGPSAAKIASIQRKVNKFCDNNGIAFVVNPDGWAFLYPGAARAILLDETSGGLVHPISGKKWACRALVNTLSTVVDEDTDETIGVLLKAYTPKGWTPTLE